MSLRKNGSLLVLCTLALALSTPPPASAATMAVEWGFFRTLCSVVEVRGSPEPESSVDIELVNRSLANIIEARLRERGLMYPVESGRQCFPGKVGSAPYQLSLQFYLTLAPGLDQHPPVVAALIMHTYFSDR